VTGLLKFIIRRLILLLPVLLIVTVLISSLLYFSPGDPVQVMLGIRANPEAVAAIRTELGLDKPAHIRYFIWLSNVAQGNLGRSLQRNEKVVDLIAEMKSQSKTGATGFGQLSDKERIILENSAAKLKTAQSDTAIREELVRIRALLNKAMLPPTTEAPVGMPTETPPESPTPGLPPDVDARRKKYGY